MKCERFRDELEDWLDGELDADERAGLERHVGDCPGCAQHLSQRRAMGAALKKTFRHMGSELHFQPRPRGEVGLAPVVQRTSHLLLGFTQPAPGRGTGPARVPRPAGSGCRPRAGGRGPFGRSGRDAPSSKR